MASTADSAAEAVSGADGTAVPRRLRQLRWSTWRGVLVRSAKGFMEDNCSDFAAALTYYAVLALFPSAIVVVALVNLVSQGDQTVRHDRRPARRPRRRLGDRHEGTEDRHQRRGRQAELGRACC